MSMKRPMTRNARMRLAVLPLLPLLLAAPGCAPLGSSSAPAILEKIADGEYDVGIRYPSKRMRYVMIVEDDEETLALTNRPAVLGEAGVTADPAVPQRADRVLAPCAQSAANWYRHTPAGYVCVGKAAEGTGG
ncbi:hypothetical protein [Azospirillum doebereinerae]|nr:hypothetical protein [Azospirillum doebereinerae]